MPQTTTPTTELLGLTQELANEFISSLARRPVRATATLADLQRALDVDLPDEGLAAIDVLQQLVREADSGLIASAGPRYFGFVIGGWHPVALAADWLVSTWDQNNGIYAAAPAASVIEETARKWVLSLLHLPPAAGVGFVTGGQMANLTGLAAARHAVLRRAGWNVEEKGLQGSPKINVIVSAESHITIYSALRLLGLGIETIKVPTDDQGRMVPPALAERIADVTGPTIVCAQAGNVNTGSFDPIDEIVTIAHRHDAWVHVDGAFGLWAAASQKYVHLVRGMERADSWATDAHKWLNVPYDCGIAIVADAAAHRAAMTVTAAYLVQTEGVERDAVDWVPEFSRRARATPTYAVLRFLGRRGVAELVERSCTHARRFAETLGRENGVKILTDVVLNQVLVRFGDSDEATRTVIKRVQEDGTCWLGGTTWHGMAAMRISVSNWSTSDDDVRMSAEAILRAWREVSMEGGRPAPALET